jgi:hypothetical protein
MLDYMASCAARGKCSQELVDTIRETWDDLEAAFGALKLSNAGCGPDGTAILAWSTERHHFEIEFEPGKAPALFYLDFESFEPGDSCWDCNYTGGGVFPARTREALELVGALP